MKERRRILFAVGLVLLALAVSYFWLSSERQRQLAVQEAGSEPLNVESSVLEDQKKGEIEVTLYVYNPGTVSPEDGFLRKTSRTIYRTDNEVLKARQIVNELLKGMGGEKPDSTNVTGSNVDRNRLRNLYLLRDGTAVVDLSAETIREGLGGITSELALIQSVTRSLRANVPSVKQVQFLVDGKPTETLAGHISITEPFR